MGRIEALAGEGERDGARHEGRDMDAMALEARAWSTLMRDAFLYHADSGRGPLVLEPQVTEALTEGLYCLAALTDQMCRQA